MAGLICPRCQEPYTRAVTPQEWVQCGKCRHRWMVVHTDPAAARNPAPVPPPRTPVDPPVPVAPRPIPVVAPVPPPAPPPAAPPPAPPPATSVPVPAPVPAPAPAPVADPAPVRTATPGIRIDSDEYIPLETREINDFTRPLTSRQGTGGAAPIPAAVPAAIPVPPLPRTPVRPRSNDAARATAPKDDPFDPGLFDRAEREARQARARQPTMAEELPTRPVVCSSCGHAFPCARADGEQEVCPVCRVSFLVVTGVQPGTPAADPLLGRSLRGCLIDRKVGEGGMGSVYHARQVSLERSVAIKVLPPDLARNRNFIARFEREAKNLARINHPNILHIYDFGEDTGLGVYFMIIEFVEGKDLGEILHQERALPSLKVLDVVRQAALGLEMAWEKGVIHRDIKPDNLMLTGDGIWKVMDFGLAKASDDDRDVTTVGVRVGTPAFMSPEQCDGIEVDFRSDIYSLGCTAYLALTGRLPFDGETPFAIMLKHKSEAIPSVRDHRPEVPDVVDQLVRRMLAKAPKDRFASLRELIDVVEDLEVRAAGTTSILRKTRGPFRALKQPETVPGVGEGNHARQTSSRTSSPPAAGMPAATPVDIPDYLKPVEPPRPRSSSEMPVPPRPPSSARITDSDRLRSKLARVRNRTQKDEVANAMADATRCEESGLYGAAAEAWRRAATLVNDLAMSSQLMERSRAAHRRHLIRRLFRFAIWTSVTAALAVVGLWAGTPTAHDFYADRQLATILASESRDRNACVRNLERFLVDQVKPQGWYEELFRTSYTMPTAAKARQALERLRAPAPTGGDQPVTPPTVPASAPTDPLDQLVHDPAVPWSEVVQRAESLLGQAQAGSRAHIQGVLDGARRQLAAQQADLATLGETWAAGRHAEALALAESYGARHPRAGSATPRLQPGRIEVVDADSGRVLTDARVTIQPVAATSAFPATASPVTGDGIFARPTGIGAIVTASATAFRSERLDIAADDATSPLVIRLHPGTVWSRPIATSMPRATLLLLDAKTVLVAQAEALLTLRLDDGEPLARIERPQIGIPLNPDAGPAQWATWVQRLGDQVVVATADGAVVRFRLPALSGGQTLFTGRTPVNAWLDKELAIKAGQRVSLIVDGGNAEAAIRAFSNQKELWRHPFPLGRREPTLWSIDDRVVLMNDQALSVRDELEGQEMARAEFTGARLSAPAVFEQGQVVVVATANGLNVIRIVTQRDPLPIRDHFGSDGVGCRLAAADRQVLVARADRSLHLLAWNGKDLEPSWNKPVALPGESGEATILALCPDHALVVDDTGVIYLFARNDGRLQRRIAHGSPVVTPPIQCGDRLLVADQAGRLTMYHLPRVR